MCHVSSVTFSYLVLFFFLPFKQHFHSSHSYFHQLLMVCHHHCLYLECNLKLCHLGKFPIVSLHRLYIISTLHRRLCLLVNFETIVWFCFCSGHFHLHLAVVASFIHQSNRFFMSLIRSSHLC